MKCAVWEIRIIRRQALGEHVADASVGEHDQDQKSDVTTLGAPAVAELAVMELYCVVCGLGSKSVAPFPDATSEDCYGGKLPWRRYRRAQLAGTFKVLVQKVCLLCYHTFVTSPLKYALGTVDKYLSAMRGKP